MNAREAAERVTELGQKLDAAETVRKEIEEEGAALALLRLSEKAVTELEALDVEIARFKAVARPVVLPLPSPTSRRHRS